MASGNYIQNFLDVVSMVSGQPLDRPVQNSTLDAFSNSRGSMSTRGSGGGLTSNKVKTVKVDASGTPIVKSNTAPGRVDRGGAATPGVRSTGILPDSSRAMTPRRVPVEITVTGGNPSLNGIDETFKPPGFIQYNVGNGRGSELGYGGDIAKDYNPLLHGPVPGLNAYPVGHGAIGKRPGKSPMLPVENMTPEVAAAWAAVERGDPGALEKYGHLLADQAVGGNVGRSSVSGGGIKIGSGGGGSVPAGQPVRIATGKTATSGQTYQQGSSGSGKPYTYQVQGDGSIKNMTTGRTTAPATRR